MGDDRLALTADPGGHLRQAQARSIAGDDGMARRILIELLNDPFFQVHDLRQSLNDKIRVFDSGL